MKIGFKNRALEKQCLSQKEATRTLGANCARKLKTRLAEMDAASVVSELIAGNPHALSGDRIGQFSLHLGGGRRLVFRADQGPPLTADGGIDWAKVESVIVVFVGDYHG